MRTLHFTNTRQASNTIKDDWLIFWIFSDSCVTCPLIGYSSLMALKEQHSRVEIS